MIERDLIMNKNLLIIGADQYGYVAKEVAESMGCFEKISFLDDKNEEAVGKISDYEKFVVDYSYAFVAIGNADFRLEFIQKLEEACYRIAILASPKAYISPSAQLMKGTIVEPMAVVHANSSVAIGCIISAGAVVNHNCFIGDACHIGCNVVIKSGCIIFAQTKVHDCTAYIPVPKNIVINEETPKDYCFEDGM